MNICEHAGKVCIIGRDSAVCRECRITRERERQRQRETEWRCTPQQREKRRLYRRKRHRNRTSAEKREYSTYQRTIRQRLRLEVLNHYAPGGPSCACCGETVIEFLCIDHVNGGGAKHRKSINGNLYNWLKREGFPKGFRVLCYNCNAALGHYGRCPHAA